MIRPQERIQTERLALRPITLADVSEIYAKWGVNPLVARYMSWSLAKNPDETKQFVTYAEKAWNTGEEYTWLIEERNKPGLIGSFGARVRQSDADFGYLMMPEFWGRGYVVEAGKPIIEWCKNLPQIERIWAVHHIDNPNSGRVMQKLGLSLEATLKNNKIYPQISETEYQDEFLYSLVK